MATEGLITDNGATVRIVHPVSHENAGKTYFIAVRPDGTLYLRDYKETPTHVGGYYRG